ncbi:MAG: M28 family peptidase [Lentimicrobiaceae bacterium]|nr:M28 family peptidase [Lentimicrobiaceae bacterium]
MKKSFITLAISLITVIYASAQTDLEAVLSQFHADSLKKTVEDLVAFDNRFCSPEAGDNKKVAQYLVQRLKDYGIENAEIDSFRVTMEHFILGDIDRYMYNVKGRLGGSEKPDSIAIIGAHLDAIAYFAAKLQNTVPGANDNATGVAVMIEIARIFHANHLVPKYGIDFMAYDAEEIGLYGSKYDAQKRKNANENIYVMLNNDMVGVQSEQENEWKTVFHSDADIAKDIQDKAEYLCFKYTLLLPYFPDNTTDFSYKNSDSWAYREIGFKTFYSHSYEDDPYYHTISDLPQRLNYNYMAEISKLHFSLLYDFAIEDITKGVNVYEHSLASAFSLYPNPTGNVLRIAAYPQNTAISRISIYDYMGREVLKNENINSYPYNIDVSGLESGLYVVKIVHSNGLQVKRFVKQ